MTGPALKWNEGESEWKVKTNGMGPGRGVSTWNPALQRTRKRNPVNPLASTTSALPALKVLFCWTPIWWVSMQEIWPVGNNDWVESTEFEVGGLLGGGVLLLCENGVPKGFAGGFVS